MVILRKRKNGSLCLVALYLQQPDPSLVTFSIKQKWTKTLDKAVVATIEMESYLPQGCPNDHCCLWRGVREGNSRTHFGCYIKADRYGQVESLELTTKWNQQQGGQDTLLDESIANGNHENLGKLVGIADSRDISPGGAPRPGRSPTRETRHPQCKELSTWGWSQQGFMIIKYLFLQFLLLRAII